MELLITLNDFPELVDVSTNVNEARRIQPHIRAAQEFDLRPFLGDPLFYDFLTKIKIYRTAVADDPVYVPTPEEQKYLDLLNGKAYELCGNTVEFEGVLPALVFYSFSRVLANHNYHTTATHMAKKLNQYSDTTEEKEIIRLKTNAESQGYGYLDKVKTFLNANKADYPLWKYSCHCDQGRIKKSGARISAI